MAVPAADVTAPGPREILRLFAPFRARASIALRVALICALTVLVTSTYATPEAALSAYVVFFLNKPDRATSALMSVVLLLIITVVIGLVLAVALFSIDYPVLRVACMAVLSAGLLYLTSASKLRPVGAILAMIVGFGLDELGIVPVGEAATRALLYVWLLVAIPVGISIAVNLVIAPSPRRLACAQLAGRLRVAARRLSGTEDVRPTLGDCLREGNQQIVTWLKLSKLEGTSTSGDVAALSRSAAASTAILVAVELADREPDARLPESFATPLSDTLNRMADILEQGGYPVDIALALPATGTLPPLARIVAADLHAAITGFAADAPPADAPTDDAPLTTAAPADAPPPASTPPDAPRAGFFLPDARTNPEHVRYALKTTAAAMFCYLLYMQLDWSGIHTCFITCYMVSLGTTAETVEKLTLRIAGCLAGALLGTAAIVYAVPSFTSVGQLMALVFAGAAVAAWVAFGSPRISYAGFQIAFAFFLSVIQGAGPGFDLTLARDRVIGILLGNIVVYLVFTRIWPVSISQQVDAALAALPGQWQRLTQIAPAVERRMRAADALARHGAIAQEIGLIHYEPSWVRPAPAWREARGRTLAELDALAGPLFLLAERAPGDAAIGARLARVSRDSGHDQAAPAGSGAPPSQSVSTLTSGTPMRAPDAVERAATTPPAIDAAHDALLNLIDARLERIAEAARENTIRESFQHARE
ncbi:Fusaric acid resistance protein conserved region [Burkholderia sp. lig30]|jgi:multidrug resistance protein MdtO|uniref:FUSC family protein n=1 Tax=Burkholderia sp. lig30 TaxID=1192124 RepID=UPI00046124B3|nr:FUSC family protein [Burkholderia sp. lig30]KDB07230.1 Fusaric acid resistance protein conserved region [Burkholderia sp. lig30]